MARAKPRPRARPGLFAGPEPHGRPGLHSKPMLRAGPKFHAEPGPARGRYSARFLFRRPGRLAACYRPPTTAGLLLAAFHWPPTTGGPPLGAYDSPPTTGRRLAAYNWALACGRLLQAAVYWLPAICHPLLTQPTTSTGRPRLATTHRPLLTACYWALLDAYDSPPSAATRATAVLLDVRRSPPAVQLGMSSSQHPEKSAGRLSSKAAARQVLLLS